MSEPILTSDHVWVCPPAQPACFGVPITLAPPVTDTVPITLAPVADAPPLVANPEPSTLLLLGASMLLLGWRLRR